MTFTASDNGTYTLQAFADPYDCDCFETFDFVGTLADTLDYAQIVANEGYEVDVWANDTLVACVNESEVSVFGYYVAA